MPTIAIFAYDFAHRKTQEFLTQLYLQVENMKVVVLCASKKKISLGVNALPAEAKISYIDPIDTKKLCEKFGFVYYPVDHDNHQDISDIIKKHEISYAFIAGARIIKGNIINLFSGGVVNFHPGPLPETAGLDSFYYTIKNQSYMGITAHYIDDKVDAGSFIDFFQLEIMEKDTIEIIQENLFCLQIDAFLSVLKKLGAYDTIPIIRPHKNSPLSLDEKTSVLTRFNDWKKNQIEKQCLINLVEKGDLDEIKKEVTKDNINMALNKSQWTPLSIASFNGHVDVVKYFLSIGANIHHTTLKGTSILMYAKTNAKNDFSLLDYLIEEGVDISHKDNFGRDIFYYVSHGDNTELKKYFLTKG